MLEWIICDILLLTLVIYPELINVTNIFTQYGNTMDTLNNFIFFITQLMQISVKRTIAIKQIWLL